MFLRRAASPDQNSGLQLSRLPALVAVLFFLASMAAILFSIWRANGGVQLYSLDDPYIHLAIAKNLALHGRYSPITGHFAAASSSVLWPFVLAGLMVIVGVKAWLPLALNLVIAVALLFRLNLWLAREGAGMVTRLIVLVALVFAIPLPGLAATGLEHVLHCLSAAALLYIGSKLWEVPATRAELGLLAFWAALATCSRYEASFEVACLCGLFLLRRRFVEIAVAGTAGLVPIVSFGLFSLRHPGGHFFPNSLLIKTATGTRFERFSANLSYFSHHLLTIGLLLVCALVIGSFLSKKRVTRAGAAGILAVLAVLCHLFFAAMGTAGRYEAYLVVLMVFAGTLLMVELASAVEGLPRLALYGVSAFCLVCCMARGVIVTMYVARTVDAIYQQQYQMAEFFATQYPNVPVANNDVGAVNFFGNASNLDLVGLASNSIANAKLAGHFDTATIDRLAREANVHYVAIYRGWFVDIPATWRYAASLTPPCRGEHFNVGGNTVAFYATELASVDELRGKLYAYQSKLPPGVHITDHEDSNYCR